MQKDDIDEIEKCVVKAQGRSDDNNIPACSTVLKSRPSHLKWNQRYIKVTVVPYPSFHILLVYRVDDFSSIAPFRHRVTI